jgi:hypothetical protein
MYVHLKQTNKQKFKVWLRQGGKVETTKHTGVKPLSQIIGPRKQDTEQNKPWKTLDASNFHKLLIIRSILRF